MVGNSAKIAVTDAKLLHHKLLPFTCLHWVADNNVVAAWFLDSTTQNIFSASPRVHQIHRLYFHPSVLSCRYCICSVEIIFIFMFMHRNQPFNYHSGCECTDFNFVADHVNHQIETGKLSRFPTFGFGLLQWKLCCHSAHKPIRVSLAVVLCMLIGQNLSCHVDCVTQMNPLAF